MGRRSVIIFEDVTAERKKLVPAFDKAFDGTAVIKFFDPTSIKKSVNKKTYEDQIINYFGSSGNPMDEELKNELQIGQAIPKKGVAYAGQRALQTVNGIAGSVEGHRGDR